MPNKFHGNNPQLSYGKGKNNGSRGKKGQAAKDNTGTYGPNDTPRLGQDMGSNPQPARPSYGRA